MVLPPKWRWKCSSIVLIGENRAEIRLPKRMASPEGGQVCWMLFAIEILARLRKSLIYIRLVDRLLRRELDGPRTQALMMAQKQG